MRHGENARGLSQQTTGLREASPDLVKRSRSHSDGDLFWKIQNGKDEMPSFEEELSANQIWHVINYLKGVAKGN